MGQGNATRRHRGRGIIVSCAAIIALAAVVAYHTSFTGPFIFDDLGAIVGNPTIRHLGAALQPPAGGSTVTARPVLNVSFAVNYALSGTNVRSYHALNLLIHVSAGLTLFGVMRRTLVGWSAPSAPDSDRLRGALDPTLTAFAIALIWTVHPLQTESVTYIAQRAESFMGLFYLLTLYCFVRGAHPESDPKLSGSVTTIWFTLSIAACLLGMGTKDVMVSAPVMVLLYDRAFVSRSFREGWRRHWRLYLGLAATWLPLAYLVVAAKGRNGTVGFGIGVSWWQYLLTQFPAIVSYLKLSAWPHPLVFDYGAQWVRSPSDVWPAAVVVGMLVAGTTAALLHRQANSETLTARGLGFAGAWFFAILSPTSLVPGLRQTMAEHRMYLALAPVVALGVLVTSRRGAWGLPVCLGLAIGLVGLTALRNDDYRSDLILWADTIAKVPDNPFARNNLGLALSAEGRLPEAAAQYREALRIDPDLAEVHNNLVPCNI